MAEMPTSKSPNLADYSLATKGELTVSVWMRPDTLNFPKTEPKKDYIHWLGKGDASGENGNQEWTFRMYNHSDPLDHPPRTNRISFYLFNPEGGLGVGSFVQVPVHKGQWIHVASVADANRTYFYRDGKFIRCDTYRGPQQGSCEIHFQDPPNSNQQLEIEPQAGSAPLRVGTKDLGSFFEGGLTRLRIWSRALSAHGDWAPLCQRRGAAERPGWGVPDERRYGRGGDRYGAGQQRFDRQRRLGRAGLSGRSR